MKKLLVLFASAVQCSTAAKVLVACTPKEMPRSNDDCGDMIRYPDPDAEPISVEDLVSETIGACVEAATGDHGLKLARYVSDDPGRQLRPSRQMQTCYGGCDTQENICDNCEVCCQIWGCSICAGWGYTCEGSQCSYRRQAEEIDAVLDPNERKLSETVQQIESLCTANVQSLAHDLNSKFQNKCLGRANGLKCSVIAYEAWVMIYSVGLVACMWRWSSE